MKKVIALAMITLAFVATGCVAIPNGSLYTNITHNNESHHSGPAGTKKGEACFSSILGLIATGDGGVKAAAAKGNITTVHVVDHKRVQVFGSLYGKYCSVVSGD